MNAAALLDACLAAGVVLQVEGDNLVVEADCDPAADLIDELREHKLELIAAISSRVAANVIDGLEERAAIVEEGAGVPREWAEGFAVMCSMPAPTGFSPERWRRIVDAAGVFIDKWAAKAIACGWSELDVFGCDAAAPDKRFDCMGLVLLLDRWEVAGLDEAGADLMTETGALLRYRRRPLPGHTISLWRLVK